MAWIAHTWPVWEWPGLLRALDIAGGVLLLAVPQGAFMLAITATVCLFGLGIFGYPLTKIFGPIWVYHRMAPVAVVLGAISGGILQWVLFVLFSSGSFMGSGDPGSPTLVGMVSSLLPGAIFGAPTGFWWWLLYRRVLLERMAHEVEG